MPTPAALARAECLVSSAAGTAVTSWILAATLSQLQWRQCAQDFPDLFFSRSIQTFAAPLKPGPNERKSLRVGRSQDLQIAPCATPDFPLKARALHDCHPAHFHRTPDHPGRVLKDFQSTSFGDLFSTTRVKVSRIRFHGYRELSFLSNSSERF